MTEPYRAGLRDAVLSVAHQRHSMREQTIGGPEKWAEHDEGLFEYSEGLNFGQELMRQADAIADEAERMAYVAQIMGKMQGLGGTQAGGAVN